MSVHLPRRGERVKIDYPGYVHHGKVVVVISCGRDKCATPVRQTYSDRLGMPLVTFQVYPGVLTAVSLSKVRRA